MMTFCISSGTVGWLILDADAENVVVTPFADGADIVPSGTT